MANNISMISMMFEEIKNLLASIEKKLEANKIPSERAIPKETTDATNPTAGVDPQKLDQIIKFILAYLKASDQKISQVNNTINETERHVLSQMQEIKRSVENQKTESSVRHYHVIDLKSSKVVVAIITLSVLLLLSVSANIQQLAVNARLAENDLKYRYIKSINGISTEHLYKLEDIFQYHRDEKKIKEIQKKVEEHEKKIRDNAEKIELQRLSNYPKPK